MLQLEKSEKFQKEYTSYQNKIEEISNDRVRTDLKVLVQTLLKQVRAIDKQHLDLMTKNARPEDISDSRSNVTETRRKIRNLIRDWDRRQY